MSGRFHKVSQCRLNLNRDEPGVQFGAPLQGILYLDLDFRGRHAQDRIGNYRRHTGKEILPVADQRLRSNSQGTHTRESNSSASGLRMILRGDFAVHRLKETQSIPRKAL